MSSVCVIQHVACETPGLIAEALEACGIDLVIFRPFRGDRIPERIRDQSGLVVLGGPMGVYDQDRYPFLRQELRLIEDTLNRRRAILGVCLGSQLLATALGAPVTRAKQKELGWHSVTLGLAAARDVLWHGLPESFVGFHWHGDIFELPHEATPLAWSRLTEHQAFRFGDSAYGLLFHLEATERMIRGMTRAFRRELREAGVTDRAVLEPAAEHLPRLQPICHTVLARWAVLASGQPVAAREDPVIRIKRVYAPSASEDGTRFLVDRFWPRGLRKDALRLDNWLKEVAPSDALRRWFSHDRAKWPEFRRRYFAELDAHPESVNQIREAVARGPVTLLFSASDVEHNNAVALREYLQLRMKSKAPVTSGERS